LFLNIVLNAVNGLDDTYAGKLRRTHTCENFVIYRISDDDELMIILIII